MIRTTLSGLRTFPFPTLPRPTVRGCLPFLRREVAHGGESSRHAAVLSGKPCTAHSGKPSPRRQLVRAATLIKEEMRLCLRRIADAVLPAEIRFPLALLSYLLLIFALEVVFLNTFQPMTGAHAPAVQAAAPAPDDADEALETRTILAEALPSSFSAHLTVARILGSPTENFSAPDAAADSSVLHASHRLLTLPPASLPAKPAVPFDSVRMAVDRSNMRMPVDDDAVHPLDRAGFLATATDTTRLRHLFARIDSPRTSLRLLAERPQSAIAPPLTRLDKLRMQQARHRRLGSLCALFESGVRGIFAVGFDSKGGTSYGKYQISSRKGAIRNFIRYLDRRAPSWAMRLKASGPSNTGGTGGAMPREWKRIASEHPRLFERLQDDFIRTRYYSPSLNEVRARTGLDLEKHPEVIKEVLWSTAVQHGPSGGANIFVKACLRAKGRPDKSYAVSLLEEVFREREKRLAKCSLRQLSALKARLRQEKNMALNRLRTAAATKTSSLVHRTDRLL